MIHPVIAAALLAALAAGVWLLFFRYKGVSSKISTIHMRFPWRWKRRYDAFAGLTLANSADGSTLQITVIPARFDLLQIQSMVQLLIERDRGGALGPYTLSFTILSHRPYPEGMAGVFAILSTAKVTP